MLDDDDQASLELQAALDEFTRLGARLDAAAVEAAILTAAERRAGPAHVRKTFMFTDIVGSTRLAEALGDEGWERVLGRHDDAIRAQVAKGGGEVVNSTGDGFFVAFDSARRAVDCAIATVEIARSEMARTARLRMAFLLMVRVLAISRRDGRAHHRPLVHQPKIRCTHPVVRLPAPVYHARIPARQGPVVGSTLRPGRWTAQGTSGSDTKVIRRWTP
jgi:hypothetical protein